MQFPSRSRRLLFVLSFFFAVPLLVIFPASLWLSWSLNPLQNFYLGDYTACSLQGSYPDALTTVRYADKTAPGRTPEPLLPDDAVKSSDPKQRLALSSKAVAEGWRGVTVTPPQKVRAKELREYLSATVYNGDNAWLILFDPSYI